MTEGAPPFVDMMWSLSVFHYFGAVAMPIALGLAGAWFLYRGGKIG